METSHQQFGLVVAYLLPGFVALVGITPLVPGVATWLQPVASTGTGIGPPVYAVLAATALGMIVSCFRWLLIDHAMQWTGVKPPKLDTDRLEKRLSTFNYFVEYHYRYYQFYSNMLVAVLWTYTLTRLFSATPFLGLGTDIGVIVLCIVLFAGSRDALSKYYERTDRIAGQSASAFVTPIKRSRPTMSAHVQEEK